MNFCYKPVPNTAEFVVMGKKSGIKYILLNYFV